jgi:hypothetical protein
VRGCVAGEGACPADIDCTGSWSRCTSACVHSYSITTQQSGQGTSCPAVDGFEQSCILGEGDCVANENCVGSWSSCNADCSDKVFTVTQPQSGDGRPCDAEHGATASCAAGEGNCPPNKACVGYWSSCDANCNDKVYTITVQPSGSGPACLVSHGATQACVPGEGTFALLVLNSCSNTVCI